MGVGFVGRIAKTGQMIVLEKVDDHRDEFFGVDLARLGKTHHCAGTAVSFRDEDLGVLVIFSHANDTRDRRAWQKIFADLIAVASVVIAAVCFHFARWSEVDNETR